jgi:hypothetical protein
MYELLHPSDGEDEEPYLAAPVTGTRVVPVYPKTSAYTASHWAAAASTLAQAERALYAAGAAGAAVRAGLHQVRATHNPQPNQIFNAQPHYYPRGWGRRRFCHPNLNP